MNKLSDINTHFAEWYQDVIYAAGLVDESPTRGTFIIRPYGFAIWENIQSTLDKKIKATGTQNAYFPLLIPQSFLQKEAKHIEGFSPELAVVTHGGGKELEEPLVVRPTSETIIYHMFARWIKSWRDLPLKVNQWANVVRWEMRTRPFIRSSEFLWQEGHTAHATLEEAIEMALEAQKIYKDIYQDYLAIPVITGVKSESERFAGAERTYTVEGLMRDGRALQMCTAHVLAHSFPASFGVQYQAKDGTLQVPYCTSFGFTTRSVGALVMTHGDQNGIIVPPRVAPTQVVIIPIFKNDEEKIAVMNKVGAIKQLLDNAHIRALVDTDDQTSPGAKFFAWELKGVPVRMEVGPKDVEKNQVVLVNRVEEDRAKKKQFIPADTVVTALQELFDTIHNTLFDRALARMKSQWHQADALRDFGPQLDANNGLYQVGWCGDAACEETLKQFKGTIRCLIEEKNHKICFSCSQESKHDILVAKAY